MNKVIFMLCEGQHDIAFLYRILKAAGFDHYAGKVKDLPAPVGGFILQALVEYDYPNLNMSELNNKPLPKKVIQKNETLVLLYSMVGGDRSKERLELIRNVKLWTKPLDEDAADDGEGLQYSFIYFLDADQAGVTKRIDEINTEISQKISGFSGLEQAGEPIEGGGIEFSAYIFASENQLGKLEDVMLPLMKKDNEVLFLKADEFLGAHEPIRQKRLKITMESGVLKETRTGRKMKFDFQKSSISIVGQLQCSGRSNVSIIEDCDFINLEKIQDSSVCKEIIDFISKSVV